jgi:hypothetical protein
MTPNGRNIPPRPMPADLRVVLRGITPDQAATLLVQAQNAYINLITGQLPSALESPQLGRVAFAATNAADLQRLIDFLNGVIATGGNTTTGSNVRKPISFLGWP